MPATWTPPRIVPRVYRKLHASPDANGNCCGGDYSRICGEPWGDQTRGLFWLEFTDLDGNTEPTTPQGLTHGHAVYDRYFRDHKAKMNRLLGRGAAKITPVKKVGRATLETVCPNCHLTLPCECD